MLDFLKRDKVQDPFGGDDLYDGESRFAGKGPKIALAASIVLFLALAGGIAAIVMTGKTTPPPVAGSLSDIEVVDEPAPAASPAAPAAAPAKTAQAPTAPDATAATDRDIQRRPWLAAPATPEAAKRPGVETAKPAAAPPGPAPKAVAEAAKPALMTPPPVSAPPAQVAAAPPAKAPTPPAATAPETKQETKPVEAAKAGPKTEPVPEAAKDAVVADANPFGPAPGAPGLFNIVPSAESGPSVAGGRPRLVDPAQPPIDKTAIAAPPPRFANIAAPKKVDAAAKTAVHTTSKIAVVIDGLGLSQSATDAAITKLPASVTLAFSPYARNLKKWTEKAKAGGHEVLIEVPMESKEFPAEDPGPLGLLTTVEAKENATRLDAILKNAGDAIGILDTEGSKFRESEPHIDAVFTKLKEKNLFYVQGEPGVRVGSAGVPTAITDVVLDERPFRAAVDARLDYAERLAKYQGSAVATLGAKPVGFERLVLWLEQAQKKGVVIAPISEVLIRANSSEPTAKAASAADPKAVGAPAETKGAPKAAPAKAPAKKS
ncbi:MAG: divergent polysaccharide deacetylase family protein [Rhodospirillaceae bacterium]